MRSLTSCSLLLGCIAFALPSGCADSGPDGGQPPSSTPTPTPTPANDGADSDTAAPLGWYPLDDTSGPAIADISENANYGTAVGNVTFANPGRIGTSLGFDGATAYVDMGVLADYDNLPAITAEAWIKLTAYPDIFGGAIVGQSRDNGDLDFGLDVGGDPPGALGWNSSSADPTYGYRHIRTAGGLVPLDTWTHVAGVYDVATNTRLIYVNGVEVALDTARSFGNDVAAPIDGTGPLRIGNYFWRSSGGNVGFLHGFIDDVKLWDVLRTQEEICADAGGRPDGAGGCTL